MSWFGSTTIVPESLIEEACSEFIPGGEIDFNKGFEIIDLLKVKKIKAKDFLKAWENKLITSRSPHGQIKLLNLIDLCIKNAGINFSLEIFAGGNLNSATPDNDFSSSYGTVHNQFLNKILYILHKSATDKIVKDKILELIETWHILFQRNSNLNHNINSIYDTLKNDNFVFPKIDNKIIFNEKFLESKVPPAWVDSDSCMIGFEQFTMINRKHHCRNCGGVFCQAHSSKTIEIPMIGLNEPVRVCDSCYDQLSEKAHKNAPPVNRHKKSSTRIEIDDEEDEMLKRALELSLKDAGPQFLEDKNLPAPGAIKEENEEEEDDDDDDDLKAAIAASLKEMKDKQVENQESNGLPEYNSSQPPQLQPRPDQTIYENMLDHENLRRITPKEEESIYLFSQLMNNLKQKQLETGNNNQFLQSDELQSLYTEVSKLKTKLGGNLNEDLAKYEKFMEMQTKMNMIVDLYDKLLEKRLQLRGFNNNYSNFGSNIPLSNNYTGTPSNYTGYSIQRQYTSQPIAPQYTSQPPVQPQYIPQLPHSSEEAPRFVHNPYQEVPSSQQTEMTQQQTIPAQVEQEPVPSEPSEPSFPIQASAPSYYSEPTVQLPSEPPQLPQEANYANLTNIFPPAPTSSFDSKKQSQPQEPKEEPLLIEL